LATADEYEALARAVVEAAAVSLTGPGEHLSAHRLPNWYPLVAEFTPETRVYPADADIAAELRSLGWG
jgi:hypothetical protein